MYMWGDGEVLDLSLPPFELLSVGLQDGAVVAWLAVDLYSTTPPRNVRVITFGTGHCYDNTKFIYWGTVQKGSLVYHIFEEIN